VEGDDVAAAADALARRMVGAGVEDLLRDAEAMA
jgi:hypothetical protein